MIALAVTDAPTEAEHAAVLAGLEAHNVAYVGANAFASVPLGVLARDAAGEIVGGLIGRSALRWLFIELLHVAPAARGKGLGARLLAAAEAAATARGCVGVRLDTFSFQAPGFYAKQGYAVFGTLDDYPPGHSRHFLFKRLAHGAAQATNGGPTCST